MSNLPLEGVKVADFSWVGAGPRATKDLADMGATVIKIESRKRLDLGRLSPPFATPGRDPDASTFFAITNTSKLGVTINLNDPRGIEVAKKLVAWADIVVENFSHGYMDRIGLSFETLRAINPAIIQISVSVAGRKGPLGTMRGYGNSAGALSGMAALSGWPDRDPHMAPFAYGDVVAPMFATVATLAALEYRRQTGQGQLIDISQTEPLIHVMADRFLAEQTGAGGKPGNRSPHRAPQGAYPARGVDQWVAIAVRSDAEWATLAETSGIADPRFATLAGRKAHEDELDATLSDWTRGQDKRVLADRLAGLGIPAEPVNDGRDVFTDPELIERGHYHPVTHGKLGDTEIPGPPLRFSDSAIHVGPPPNLGEHNHAVFVDLLGMSAAEVRDLTDAGALA